MSTFPERMAAISGLRAYWPCDDLELSGDGIADTSGNGHSFAISNAGNPNFEEAGARVDTGTSVYNNLGGVTWETADHADLDLTTAGTILLYIKRKATGDQSASTVICKGTSGSFQNNAYLLRYDETAGAGSYKLQLGDGATTAAYLSITAAAVGTWQHVAITWDGASVIGYSNFVAVGTAAQTVTPNNNTSVLLLGGATGVVSPDANYDEIGLVGRAMTADEIDNLGTGSGQAPGVWVDWHKDGFADPADATATNSLPRLLPQAVTEGVTDNITEDVISFNWTRGGSSNHLSPSAPDSCTIIVKNADGKYSPDNTASPLHGLLLPHRPVWIGRNADMTLQGSGQTVHGVWAGRIRSVAPVMPTAGVTPTAQIICEGITGAYERAGAYVLGEANRTHAALRQLILESMNEEESRLDLDAETGVIDYSWVGGDLRETTKGIAEAESGLQALNELNSATGSRHFIRPSASKDDWYQYVSTNRYWKLQSASDVTLNGDDIHAVPEWETGEASIITYQEAEYTPAEVLAAGTVWGPYTEVPFNMTVAASRTIWGRFEDFVPNGTAVVASTGATITQSFANYGRMFSLTLYASGNATVTAVHIEGDMLNRLDTERMAESSSATEAVYGRRNGQVVTSRFVGSPENGFGLTHFLIWKFAGPLRSGRVVIKNKPSLVNSRDLYDLATVTIDALYVANDRFEIVNEEGECNRATESGIVDWTTTWTLQKSRNPEPLTDDQLAELE